MPIAARQVVQSGRDLGVGGAGDRGDRARPERVAGYGGGLQETFTVRKVSYGVGVERTFPLHSPIIDKIEVVSLGDVRRAKLYYLRDRIGKAAKVKEKRVK